ncbi:ABC transporter permease [Rhodococcus triatomae]|uniref:Sulfonate transport system permease protein n=1 Tax=Rhodococcus triatomae TaxID=300028 RepID=A0A1G8EUQ6_9NOCA|nr:ABC transporter permease [Rhodococcus triatomae]QNG19300.1 ABC transporter permease [Rhodococcus triatomae]QNG24787.1 ABC transporter permease [Rhodococcus triatomae]SDH73662.1 sulfonate transport system permease protein [Rhodococcus triatomae]
MLVTTGQNPADTATEPVEAPTATTTSTAFYRRPGFLRSLAPVVLLLAWQFGSQSGLLSERVLPAPSVILAAGVEVFQSGALMDALAVSTQRVLIGFALGAALGVGFGIAAGVSRLGEYIVDPPLQMLRTIPLFGLIPLFIIWFGIGEQPKVYLIALGVAFPLYLNTFAGIRRLDPKLLELASVLQLSRTERLRNLILPGALPQILVGLRQSLGIAWLSLIVAEQINASEGLGFIVNNAREFLRTDIVIFGLLVYGLLGLITDSIVRSFELRALRWQPTVVR